VFFLLKIRGRRRGETGGEKKKDEIEKKSAINDQ